MALDDRKRLHQVKVLLTEREQFRSPDQSPEDA